MLFVVFRGWGDVFVRLEGVWVVLVVVVLVVCLVVFEDFFFYVVVLICGCIFFFVLVRGVFWGCCCLLFFWGLGFGSLSVKVVVFGFFVVVGEWVVVVFGVFFVF